jgi:hypothetical protein
VNYVPGFIQGEGIAPIIAVGAANANQRVGRTFAQGIQNGGVALVHGPPAGHHSDAIDVLEGEAILSG